MAITATLVHASPNWLRYLIVSDATLGESMYIQSLAGGATPNLRTDSPAGAIHAIASVGAYGKIAALTTQAQARALWLSADAESVVGPAMPTAECQYTVRTGVGMLIDAEISGTDATTVALLLSAPTSAAGNSGYLDVFIPGAIGV